MSKPKEINLYERLTWGDWRTLSPSMRNAIKREMATILSPDTDDADAETTADFLITGTGAPFDDRPRTPREFVRVARLMWRQMEAE